MVTRSKMRNSSLTLPVPLAHHVTKLTIHTPAGYFRHSTKSVLLQHQAEQVVMTLLDKHLEQISQSATAIADLAYAPRLTNHKSRVLMLIADFLPQESSPTRCCILMISPLLFGILKCMKVLYLPQQSQTLPRLMPLDGVRFTRKKALPQMALVYSGTRGMILPWQHF